MNYMPPEAIQDMSSSYGENGKSQSKVTYGLFSSCCPYVKK